MSLEKVMLIFIPYKHHYKKDVFKAIFNMDEVKNLFKKHFTTKQEQIAFIISMLFAALFPVFLLLFLISCFISTNWWLLLWSIFFSLGPSVIGSRNNMAYKINQYRKDLEQHRKDLEKDLEE